MLVSETLNLKLNNKQTKMLINSGQKKEETWSMKRLMVTKVLQESFLSFNGHIVKLLTQGEGRN